MSFSIGVFLAILHLFNIYNIVSLLGMSYLLVFILILLIVSKQHDAPLKVGIFLE